MKERLIDTELKQIGIDYVKLLLEVKYGCRVKHDGTGIEVWSPKGYNRNTIQVNVGERESPLIAVLIAKIINGRKVPVICDYHLLKIVGVEGVYSLEEEKLQQLLLDNNTPEITAEDGCAIYSLFDRQLLLDKCTYVPA